MAIVAERLPVGLIVEQVGAVCCAFDVIQLRGLSRPVMSQAFGAEAVFWIGVEP